MTRDDVIKLAREAGMGDLLADGVVYDDELDDFAALVAAAEREACAKLCDELEASSDYTYADECATAIRARKDSP